MNRNILRALVVASSIAFTLSLHYMLLPLPEWGHRVLHETELHRRLCYLPIILGALWFGLRGGLLTAAAISAAVLPLALRYSGPLASNADFVEICFYMALGVLTGVLVDVKERERTKKERLEKELASSERMAALGRAAAGIAHEVRTPLGSIQGAAEILGEDYPEGHPRRSFFDILMEECRRLGRVVDDFLDLGRPMSLGMAPGQVDPILDAALQSVRPLAEEKGIVLARRASPEGAVVRLDAHRVHQALVNLLRNAIQVSARSGSVSLQFRLEEAEAIFEVIDSGPGIGEGDEERIFEPFFSRREDGTGLGLPLARQVALSHGGSLRAATREGGGAAFSMRIPQKDEVVR
jgi:two-component system, NtrC family, sensor histidine kinase HydH